MLNEVNISYICSTDEILCTLGTRDFSNEASGHFSSHLCGNKSLYVKPKLDLFYTMFLTLNVIVLLM